MKRSKQANQILDIIKASEAFSMGAYRLIELALRELDEKVAESEVNKHYIELGKAVEKVFEMDATDISFLDIKTSPKYIIVDSVD
jgi:hypothetical protein